MKSEASRIIETENLRLIAGDAVNARAALDSLEKLAELLKADILHTWPPPISAGTEEFTAQKLSESPDESPWWVWYIVLKGEDTDEPDVLIGNAGFKGRPQKDSDGHQFVEIGYAILDEYQKNGYGTEAAEALVAWAFSHAEITKVIAETQPELGASVKVMQNCGMTRAMKASEPGLIRYELIRDDFQR